MYDRKTESPITIIIKCRHQGQAKRDYKIITDNITIEQHDNGLTIETGKVKSFMSSVGTPIKRRT